MLRRDSSNSPSTPLSVPACVMANPDTRQVQYRMLATVAPTSPGRGGLSIPGSADQLNAAFGTEANGCGIAFAAGEPLGAATINATAR